MVPRKILVVFFIISCISTISYAKAGTGKKYSISSKNQKHTVLGTGENNSKHDELLKEFTCPGIGKYAVKHTRNCASFFDCKKEGQPPATISQCKYPHKQAFNRLSRTCVSKDYVRCKWCRTEGRHADITSPDHFIECVPGNIGIRYKCLTGFYDHEKQNCEVKKSKGRSISKSSIGVEDKPNSIVAYMKEWIKAEHEDEDKSFVTHENSIEASGKPHKKKSEGPITPQDDEQPSKADIIAQIKAQAKSKGPDFAKEREAFLQHYNSKDKSGEDKSSNEPTNSKEPAGSAENAEEKDSSSLSRSAIIAELKKKAKQKPVDQSKERAAILQHYNSAKDKKNSAENKGSQEHPGITASEESKELSKENGSQPTRAEIFQELKKEAKQKATDRSKQRAAIVEHYSSNKDKKDSAENKDSKELTKNSRENKDSNEHKNDSAENKDSKEEKSNAADPSRSDIINEFEAVAKLKPDPDDPDKQIEEYFEQNENDDSTEKGKEKREVDPNEGEQIPSDPEAETVKQDELDGGPGDLMGFIKKQFGNTKNVYGNWTDTLASHNNEPNRQIGQGRSVGSKKSSGEGDADDGNEATTPQESSNENKAEDGGDQDGGANSMLAFISKQFGAQKNVFNKWNDTLASHGNSPNKPKG